MRCDICSIVDAREERLLDHDGTLVLRLICNACGSLLHSEVFEAVDGAARLWEVPDSEALHKSCEA